MIITAITQQKQNKSFYNIFINEEYYCSLDDEAIYTMKLKEGMEIEPEVLMKVSKESAYKKALNYSLNLLGKCSKTTSEIQKKLKQKEYMDETIEAVIQKLTDFGYINDENYTEMFIRSTNALNKRALYTKMLQKGLDKELITEKLQNVEINEYQNALKIAQKKLITLKGTYIEKKSKLYTYLYSKGFDFDICSKVVNNIDITE